MPPALNRTGVSKWIWTSLALLLCPCVFGERVHMETREIVSQRDAFTRVYENLFEVPEVDAWGRPTGRTRIEKSRYYVKASGLNYDIQDYERNPEGSPIWVPTDCTIRPSSKEGLIYEVESGRAKVYFGDDITDDYSVGYRMEGKTLRTGIVGIGYYDRESGRRRILQTPRRCEPAREGNRLVYPGVFSGADLEFVYERSRFHTNLILGEDFRLPSPGTFGMEPSSTFLVVVFRMDLGGYSRNGFVGRQQLRADTAWEGRALRVDFKNEENRVVHYLDKGMAQDSSEVPSETAVFKRLVRGATDTYLLEGVLYSWLAHEDRTYPVTIDPVQVDAASEMTHREVWTRGNTYVVQSLLQLAGEAELLVEGGAVIKCGTPGQTNSEGGILVDDQARFRSLGGPRDYVIFTSANDNTVGEPLSGATYPQPTDYAVAIQVSSSDTGNVLQYLKVRYAKTGLFVATSSPEKIVGHNIVRDCLWSGIRLGVAGSNTIADCTVANNLVTDCHWGIQLTLFVADQPQRLKACIYHNTVDNMTANGILVNKVGSAGFLGDLILDARYNLFSNCASNGIRGLNLASGDISDATSTVEDNGFYMVNGTSDWSDDINHTSLYITAPDEEDNIHLEVHPPYDVVQTANGSHYLNRAPLGGALLRDLPGVDLNLGLENKTVDPPTEIAEDLASAVWRKSETDVAENDIGYHHDRVDYVIGAPQGEADIEVSGTLIVEPGVVIAFNETSSATAKLKISQDGRITARGVPGHPIVWDSVLATSPESTTLPGGTLNMLTLESDSADNDSVVEFCHFSNAAVALRLERELAAPISDNVFRNCRTAAAIKAENPFRNNLFLGSADDALQLLCESGADYNAHILNNTFDANRYGVFLNQPTSGGDVDAWLSGNLFIHSITKAVNVEVQSGTPFSATFENNLYWNNTENLDDYFASMDPSDSTACPLVVKQLDRIHDEWSSHYALDQQNGDVSAQPVWVSDLADTSAIHSVRGVDNAFHILVGASERTPYVIANSGSSEYLGRLAVSSSTYYPGSATESGPLWVALRHGAAIELLDIQQGASFKIDFDNGSQIEVLLPEVSDVPADAPIAFWVARDGSTYYAHSSHTWTGYYENSFDQDALYSCMYGSYHLAQQAHRPLVVKDEEDESRIALLGGDLYTHTSHPETVHGKAGTALEFDGDDDKVVIEEAIDFSGGDFTFEAWVKPNSVGTGTLLSSEESGCDCIVFYLSSLYPTFYSEIGECDPTFYATEKIDPGVWTHVAFTYDNSSEEIRIYKNGRSITPQANSVVLPSLTTPETSMGKSAALLPYFEGALDEMRLSSVVRDVEQLWLGGHYDASLVKDASTVALWRFDSSPAVDYAGVDSYDYGTTAGRFDSDLQSPDSGFHYYGQPRFDDDGVEFQFSWGSSPVPVTGEFDYELYVRQYPDGEQVTLEVDRDGTINFAEQLGAGLSDGDYLFTVAAVADDVRQASSNCLVTVDTRAPQGCYARLIATDEAVKEVTGENGHLEEIVFGSAAREIRLEACFPDSEPNPWKVRFGEAFDSSGAVIADESPYRHIYRLNDQVYDCSSEIEVRFYDGAGNCESVEFPILYHEPYIDETTPPQISPYLPRPEALSQIAWGEEVEANATLQTLLSFSASDGQNESGVRSASIYWVEQDSYLFEEDKVHSAAPSFQCSWDTAEVPLGKYELIFSATDWAGNVASVTRQVKVVPGPLDSLTVEPAAVALCASEEAGFQIAGWDKNGKPMDVSDGASTDVTWSLAGETPANDTFIYEAIAVGVYSLVADASKTDYASIARSASATATIQVLAATAVKDLEIDPKNAVIAKGGSKQFTAAATDFHGNPVTTPAVKWSLQGSDAVGTISSSGLYSAPSDSDVSDGQQFTVKVESLENSTASDTATVRFDLSEPDVYFIDPAPLEVVSGTQYAVSWAVNERVRFDLSVDSKLNLDSSQDLVDAGVHSATWDTTLVVDGYHTLTVAAEDSVGNAAQDSVSVLVQNNRRDNSIAQAVSWLLAHQKTSGFWDEQLDSAATAFAIRAASEASLPDDYSSDREFLASLVSDATSNNCMLAYALIAGDATQAFADLLLDPDRRCGDGGWGKRLGDDSDIYTTALANLGLYYHGTGDSTAEAYLLDILTNDFESIKTDTELASALFSYAKSTDTIDDVSPAERRLIRLQRNCGGWENTEATAWAALALVACGTDYDVEYSLFAAADYLNSFGLGLNDSEEPVWPAYHTALACWALADYADSYERESTGLNTLKSHLASNRAPANYQEGERGERGWRNFGDDFSESMVVMNTLRALLEGPEKTAIQRALIGSSTWSGASAWMTSESSSEKEDSLEHLSRRIESAYQTSALFEDSEYEQTAASLVQLAAMQFTGTPLSGGYGERQSRVDSDRSLVDTALTLPNLYSLYKEGGSYTPFESVLDFLVGSRYSADEGWAQSGGICSPTAEVYPTTLALLAIKEVESRGYGTIDGADFGFVKTKAQQWLAQQQIDSGTLSGSFNGNVVETALAYLALFRDRCDGFDRPAAYNYIDNSQLENGSWNHKPLDTALALLVKHYTPPPDFELGRGDVEGSVGANNSVSLVLEIENQGSTDYIGPLCIGLYDDDPDAEDSTTLRLGECYTLQSATYETHSSTEITIALSEFNYQPEIGMERVYVKVDPWDQIREEKEDNNTDYVNLRLLTAPDLAAYQDRILFSPDNPGEKNWTTLGGNFLNRGEIVPATDVAYSLRLHDADGPELASVSSASTDSARVYLVEDFVAAYSEGHYPLVLEVDPQDNIAEAYEDNNSASRTVEILPIRGFGSSDLALKEGSVVFTPANPEVGQPVVMHLIVQNLGQGLAETSSGNPIEVRIKDNDRQIGGEDFTLRHTLGGIRPNDFGFLTLGWIFTAGAHSIEVTLDPDGDLLSENSFNTDNNTLTENVFVHGPGCGSPVDLAVSTSYIQRTGDEEIRAVVHNHGQQPAQNPFTVAAWQGNPDNGGELLDSAQVSSAIQPGASATVDFDLTGLLDSDTVNELYIVCSPGTTYQGGYDYYEASDARCNNTAVYRLPNKDTGGWPDFQVDTGSLYFGDRLCSATEQTPVYALVELGQNGTVSSVTGAVALYNASTRNYIAAWDGLPHVQGRKWIVSASEYLPAGDNRIQVVADPWQTVVEDSEANNAFTRAVAILGSVTPDLSIEHHDFAEGLKNDLRLAIDALDQTVLVNALVHNLDPDSGEAANAVKGATVNFYWYSASEEISLGMRTIDLLPGGGAALVQIDSALSLAEIEDGTMAVAVDRTLHSQNGGITEASEENNLAEVYIGGMVYPPTAVLTYPGDTQVTLTWQDRAGTPADSTAGYNIYLAKASDLTDSATPTTLHSFVSTQQTTIENLENLEEYVAAITTLANNGLESEPVLVSFIPIAKPVITEMNDDPVYTAQIYASTTTTVDIKVEASSGCRLQLFRNGVQIGDATVVNAYGFALFPDVSLLPIEQGVNVFIAVARTPDGQYTTEPSDPITAVYDTRVDLAIFSQDISLKTTDLEPIEVWELGNYLGETILIEAVVHNIAGGNVPAASHNTVHFEYGNVAGATTTIAEVTDVAVWGHSASIAYATFAVPELDLVKDVTVAVDFSENITEVWETNNSASLNLQFDPVTHFGRDFWFADPRLDGTTTELYIYAKSELDSATIVFNKEIRLDSELDTEFSIPTEQFVQFDIPIEYRVGECTTCGSSATAELIESKGIHFTATVDVSAFYFYPASYKQDSFLLLPTDLLSNVYIVGGYQNVSKSYPGSFTVVAVHDNTQVFLNNSESAAATIDAGSTYTYFLADGDLTGSVVSGSNDFVLVYASELTAIPYGIGQTDGLCTFTLPLRHSVSTYATVPFPTWDEEATNGLVRVVGEPETEIYIDGSSQATTIGSRGFYEIDDASPHLIVGSPGEITVFQYTKGIQRVGNGDPNILQQFPVSAFTTDSSISFHSPPLNQMEPARTIWLNILADSETNPDGISIDDAIDITDWTQIGSSDIRYATYEWSNITQAATHEIINASNIPVMAYLGVFGYCASYGHPLAFMENIYSSTPYPGEPDLSLASSDIIFTSTPSHNFATGMRFFVHNEDSGSATAVLVHVYYEDVSEATGLLEDFLIPVIGPYGSVFRDLDVTVQPDWAKLWVEVDPFDSIAESNETNNSASKELSVDSLDLADLRINGGWLNDSSPEIGETVVVNVTVENCGDVYAGKADFLLSLSDDSDNFDESVYSATRTTLFLPQGATEVLQFAYEVKTHGKIIFDATADPMGIIREASEENNHTELEFVLTAPDLVVVSGPSHWPPFPEVGETCSISNVIQNYGHTINGVALGEDISGTIRISLFDGDPRLGGQLIGSDTRNGLNNSFPWYPSIDWTPQVAGRHQIFLALDPNNAIAEIYANHDSTTVNGESNNLASSWVTVGSDLPDLRFENEEEDVSFTLVAAASEVTPREGITEGQSIRIAATVTSASDESHWAKLSIYDGDPELSGTSRIADDVLLGYLPEDGTKTAQILWDTTRLAGDNRLYFDIDEPGHLACANPYSSTNPSTAGLQLSNLAGHPILTATDAVNYSTAEFGMTLDLLSGTTLPDATWYVEVHSATAGSVPDVTLGRYIYGPGQRVHASYIDGATLSSPGNILLRIYGDGSELPGFREGQEVTIHVAEVDSTTASYELPVYLPDNSRGQYGEQVYLWVASDGSTYFANEYHLSGDYSPEQPLRLDRMAMDATAELTTAAVDQNVTIWIGGSDGVPSAFPAAGSPSTYMGSVDVSGGEVSYSTGQQNGTLGWILLEAGASEVTFSSTAALSMHFEGDQNVSVSLADLSISSNGNIAFWISQRGSLYYAGVSHATDITTTSISSLFEQTLWQALSPAAVVGATTLHRATAGAATERVGYPNLTCWQSMHNGIVGVVEETVESNNRLVIQADIQESQWPDYDGDLTLVRNTVEIGQELELPGLVYNHGVNSPTAVQVLYYAESAAVPGVTREIGVRWLGKIDHGESLPAKLVWSPTEAGTYTVTLSVDPDNAITESGPSAAGIYSNTASAQVVVSAPTVVLDVTPYILQEGEPVYNWEFAPGETVGFELFVKNEGTSAGSYEFDGGVYSSGGWKVADVEHWSDLAVVGLLPGATEVDNDGFWESGTYDEGEYYVRANLYEWDEGKERAIASATAAFSIDIDSPTQSQGILFASVSSDRFMYPLGDAEGAPQYVNLTGYLKNESIRKAFDGLLSVVSIQKGATVLYSATDVTSQQIQVGESYSFERQTLLSDLTDQVSNPIGVYDIVLDATGLVEGATSAIASATSWFYVDSWINEATLEIAASDSSPKEIFDSSPARALSKVDSAPLFGSSDWVTASTRVLRSWYGGGKNLVFNPGFEFDSTSGDGLATGWAIAGEGTTATAAARGSGIAQSIEGATPELSTDNNHDPFVERVAPYMLSFDYKVTSASGGLLVKISEYDGNHSEISTLWYDSRKSGKVSAGDDYCWTSSNYEWVELPLAYTSPFTKRMKIAFCGISGVPTQTLTVDNVQLEKGSVATVWEDSEPNNLLVNSGFEQWNRPLDYTDYLSDLEQSSSGAEGWWTNSAIATIAQATDVSVSGSSSIKISGVTSEADVLRQRLIEVVPDATYTVSLWTRKSGAVDYDLIVDQYTAAETTVPSSTDSVSVTPTTADSWSFHELTISTTSDTRYAAIRINGQGTGDLWIDNVQMERGESPSAWMGMIAFNDALDWALQDAEGDQVAHVHFMNDYGRVFGSSSSDLAIDDNADGEFDNLAGSRYAIYDASLDSEISGFAAGGDIANLFDEDSGLETGMVLGASGSEINLLVDLGATYRVTDVAIALDQAISGTPEIYYSYNNRAWYSASGEVAKSSSVQSGFDTLMYKDLGTFDGRPLRKQYLRIRFTSQPVCTMEIRDVQLRGYEKSTLDTALLDETAPTIDFSSPEEGSFTASATAVVEVTGVETYLADVWIGDSTQQWLWTDTGQWIYSASDTLNLSLGDNVFSASAVDLAGHITTATVPVHYDPTPPTIQIVSHEDDEVVGTANVVIEVTGVEVNLAEVCIAGTTVEWTDLGGNVYSASRQITLSEGANNIAVGATDVVDLSGSDSITLHYDSTPPTIQIVSHEDDEVVGTANVVIEVTGVEVNLAEVNIAGTTVEWTDLGGNVYSASRQITLSEGANNISVSATDVVDLSGSASITLHYDSTPPLIAIFVPADGTVYPATTTVIDVTVAASDDYLSGVYIEGIQQTHWWDSDDLIYYATAAVNVSATNSWLIVSASAVDQVSLTDSATASYYVDTLPPVPNQDEIFDDTSFVSNGGTDYWNNLTAPLVLGATDNITADLEIEFTLVGDVTPEYASYVTMASAPSSIDLHSATDGLKSATVCYRDGVGNIGSAILDSVYLDRSAPSVDIVSPATDSNHSATMSIQVTGGDEYGVGLQTSPGPLDYRFTVFEPTDWEYLSSLSPYSFIGSATDFSSSGVFDTETRPDGRNTLEVRVSDRLGNKSTDLVAFNIDNDEPPAAPTNLDAIADATDTIHLTWEENTEDDLDGYKVYRSTTSGTPYVHIADVGLATAYYDIDSATNNIDEATQYYVVTAYDKAGNESKYSNEDDADLRYPEAPEPPINLVAYSGNAFVQLYWDSDLNPSLVEYNVYRKLDGGSYSRLASEISSTTTQGAYRDTSVSNGSTYYYYVTAYYLVNPGNESSRSHEVCGKPTSGTTVRRIYRRSVGMEDLKNRPSTIDWDFNDLSMVMDATDTLDSTDPFSDTRDIDIYFEITQREAGHNKYVYAEFEVISGTAILSVERSHSLGSASTPSSATCEIQSPTGCMLVLYADLGNSNDPGKYSRLTIESKSSDFKVRQWVPWFKNLSTGEQIYPEDYAPGNNSQKVEDQTSPLYMRHLDYVIIIEDSGDPVTFSSSSGEEIWVYYPDFVDYILSGKTEKPYWYRN